MCSTTRHLTLGVFHELSQALTCMWFARMKQLLNSLIMAAYSSSLTEVKHVKIIRTTLKTTAEFKQDV